MSNAVQTAVAAYLSGRNRIINGHALINQRSTTGVSLAGSFVYGGPDHWTALQGTTTGGQFTQNQAAANDVNGISKFWVRQTVNTIVPDLSGVKYWGGISQAIEGNNIYDLKGTANGLVVSFQFLATLSGRYSIALFDNANTWTYVAPFNYAVGGTPQYFSFSLPSPPNAISTNASATNFLMLRIGGLNAGSLQCPVINEKQWVNAGYYNATGVTNWAANVSNFISVTDVQLEPGPVATPFEHKKFQEHLLDCQRYYWNTYPYGTAPGTAAQDGNSLAIFTGPTALSTSYLGPCLTHPAQMRIIPSCTVWNPHLGATQGSAWAQNAAASLAASPVGQSQQVVVIGLTAQPVAAVDFIKFHASFNAEF